jgi:F-type H+-transporting ATPase subunit epsilon
VADIEVEIVGTEGKLWSGTAWQVSAKAGEGEIGILAGHEPLLSVLQPGEVRVLSERGAQPQRWQVEGGFLSFDSNHLTIVVDDAVAGARGATPSAAPAAH